MEEESRISRRVVIGILRQAATVQTWILSVLGMVVLAGQVTAFDKQCRAMDAQASELSPAVVQVHTVGRATGTYLAVEDGTSQWRLGTGSFTLHGRGFVRGQLVVTAAHVIYPSRVDMQTDQLTTTSTPVVAVQHVSISIGPQATRGVPAEIAYLNPHLDLAILRPAVPHALTPFPYHPTATWWHESLGAASSLLQPGDCVVALVAGRDAQSRSLAHEERRSGSVVAPHAISVEHSVMTGLNPNTVTVSTPAFPGDSGSPVVDV